MLNDPLIYGTLVFAPGKGDAFFSMVRYVIIVSNNVPYIFWHAASFSFFPY